MLYSLKISHKITLLSAMHMFLLMLVSAIAFIQMSKIGKGLVEISEKDIPLSNSMSKITEHQLEKAILLEKSLVRLSFARIGDDKAQDELHTLKKKLLSLETRVMEELSSIKSFLKDSIESDHSMQADKVYKGMLSALEKVEHQLLELHDNTDSLLIEAESLAIDELKQRLYVIEKQEASIDQLLVSISENIQNFTLASATKAESDERNAIQMISYLAMASLIFGSIMAAFIVRSIIRPLKRLKQRIYEIAQEGGDLTQQLDDTARDEVGAVSREFNKLINMLRDMIKSIRSNTDSLERSSFSSVDTMNNMFSNIETQKSETDAVATAVNEMSITSQEVAQNTQSAAEFTQRLKETVLSGKSDAEQTRSLINQLTKEIADASVVISNLVEETNNIGSVLEAIQGIAEQTNLLALNAAIEAARAGETGRGFAVVADEVRSLAQRTQTSTVDIQNLVERLKLEARNAVDSMQKGNQSAESCLDISSSSSSRFEESAKAVHEITELNVQIATAASQQFSVAEEVNRNLTNISNVAEATTSSASQANQANQEIASQVASLNGILKQFKA